MSDLDKVETQLQEGKPIEDILEKYDWKKFEGVVAEIFQENGFHTRQNFRFKTKRRYEIDVIAVKNNEIFCIDCKWWGRGRYKKTGLIKAADLQENRADQFEKFLSKNPIAENLIKSKNNSNVKSLIITLHEEDIVKESSTFVVPVWKLNQFIQEFENYI